MDSWYHLNVIATTEVAEAAEAVAAAAAAAAEANAAVNTASSLNSMMKTIHLPVRGRAVMGLRKVASDRRRRLKHRALGTVQSCVRSSTAKTLAPIRSARTLIGATSLC
jgi:hypothetical protein